MEDKIKMSKKKKLHLISKNTSIFLKICYNKVAPLERG